MANEIASSTNFEEILLVVDDEPEVVEVLLECAAKAGVRAVGSTNPIEAQKILEEQRAFLILVDFRMPQEDGLTFFERVRSRFPTVPGILVTANADKAAALRAMKVGILDVIEKPFKVADVVRAVKTQKDKRLAELMSEAAALKAIAEGFVAESEDILQGIDSLILELENSGGKARHIVDNLYRRVHTIKGCSRSIPGTEAIFEISHAWETLLSTFRDGRASPSALDVDRMLKAADALRKCIGTLFSDTPFLPDLAALLSEFSAPDKTQVSVVDDGIIWVEQPPGVGVAPVASAAPKESAQISSQSDTSANVSVNVKKIDSFMELTGELVVLRNSLQSVLEGLIKEGSVGARAVKPFAKELSEITARLQRDVLSIRRVRFDSITQSLQRTVREVARGLKKEIQLVVEGGETEIDRDIAKRIAPALVHLVRNSCDHGIELPAERFSSGKKREGTISIRAVARSGFVDVFVEDNGRGLSREKILKKAVEKKMIDSQAAGLLPDSEVFNFIFGAGFSTATVVSDVSGRGVGMDVVRTEVAAVGGTVKIDSTHGLGARFTISIPEIRSVMVEKLVVFSLGELKIALPMGSVSTIFRFSQKSVVQHPSRAELEFQDQLQPLLRPHELFRSFSGKQFHDSDETLRMGVLLVHKNRRVALEVHDIENQIDAVIRPLDATTKNVPACKGIALLSEDELAYALSPERLVERAYAPLSQSVS